MTLTNGVLETIKSALASGFSERLIEGVLKRLDSFGYEIKESDAWMIGFALQKVENTITNECNIQVLPEGLYHICVDMSCGEFLFIKKQTGKIEIADLDLDGAVSSIREGDVSINFTGPSDEERLNSFINFLMNNGRGDFTCYRKMHW